MKEEQVKAALQIAVDIAVPIAREEAALQANGDFLKMLMQLLELLMPIILKLLNPSE